jgi:hypothetical protein
MAIERMNIEVLEGCRAVTGMSAADYAAAFGLARKAIPKNASGGTILEITPNGQPSAVRVYALAREGRFLIGLRTDFEKMGLAWGRMCDTLDKNKDRQVTG